VPELLQDWVTAQADARPDALAVVGDGEAVTYAQLEMGSNRLARVLKDAGCSRGDRICLSMPKSPAAITGILGIYKADCIYVPLDPSGPAERMTNVLRRCGCKWILGGSQANDFLEDSGAADISMGWIDDGPVPPRNRLRAAFILDDARAYADTRPPSENTGEAPAHILFTSGSTGGPKGVVITHRNVIRFIEWAVSHFGISASDRHSGHPPLPFDLSFLDIFGTLAAGAQLHLVPGELNVAPKKLADFIRNRRLTQWFSVPSLLHYMAKFDAVAADGLPDLKRVLWCGEVLPTPSLLYWMKRLPRVQFTNLYGPTETTIASSYYTVPRCPEPSGPIPIGVACSEEELLVLDDKMQPVPQGGIGELCIGGAGVSRGYWEDPEGTRKAFVPHPFGAERRDRIYKSGDLARVGDDGLVYFLGRKDSQIKSRGYRIELGEIEGALSTIEGIQESAVVAIADEDMDAFIICCAYVPVRGATCRPVTLRQSLSRSLPRYMLPVHWRRFDLLPKNASGKIDRRALKEEFVRSVHVTPTETHAASHTPR
jgi:amino acid adenylation domain-containing protein